MADMSEAEIYEAFGLKAPTGGEPGGEPASAPAAGEPGGEPASAPAAGEPGGEPAPTPVAEEPGGEPAPASAAGQEQTTEERRANAARRRAAEWNAKIESAKKEAVEGFLQRAGLTNPMTGEAITTVEQFNAWENAHAAAKLQKELSEGKLTPEGLNAAISQHPTVRAAAKIVENRTVEERQAEEDMAWRRLENDLAEIQKLDPKVKSIGEILAGEKGKEIYDLVTQKGVSLAGAWKMTNFDRLQMEQAERARQQAMASARSKEHLKGTNPRGDGMIEVPAAEMELFRAFNPKATDEQIRDYYNKHRK